MNMTLLTPRSGFQNLYRISFVGITLLVLAICSIPPTVAQPTALVGDISIRKVLTTVTSPVRIDKNPLTGELYYLNDEGNMYKVDTATNKATLLFSSTQHGLNETFGFDIGATGNIYLTAAENVNGFNVGKVAKGTPDGTGGYTWSLMAETVPYRHSGNRDHKFNAVIESSDGQFVYVNSGSRTDHGEEAKNDGLREMPLTSAILKIPVSAHQLILQNTEVFLSTNGYLFADGIRNTFDLEYAPNGDLFGVENSDTRDNEEELNWLQEGNHYGFPWKIGTHHNPQQFPGFNPPSSDPLLVSGINMESTFYNDPTFPAPPTGIAFTEPIINVGPDANIIRDSVDGIIKNASLIGRAVGTFTPHSSPVALTFDTDMQLGGDYTGKGFAMSYNASAQKKYTPFLDPGEDLMLLALSKDQGVYTTQITRIAQGFSGPIDAVLLGHKMYVLEYRGRAIYEVTFPKNDALSMEGSKGSINEWVSTFPNPARSKIILRSNSPAIQIQSASLFDIWGRAVGNFEVSTTEELLFQAKNLIPGVYFIRVETNEGLALKKIVKE